MSNLREQALRQMDEALEKPPAELKAELDVVERTVAALRDELISQLRTSPDSRTREELDQVNAALSLIVGLEYPVGGIQREMLKQARSALRSPARPATN
jgi:HPt (histidine-containing phosphotransfer) domain-containing protein